MSAAAPSATAYVGATTHARLRPFAQRFRYRIAQIMVDIDRVPEVSANLRLFSHNRPNVFAFYDRDHGDRTGAPLRPWAEAMFAKAGLSLGGGRIDLMCFPRMLGFVFNPLSLYFGRDRDGRLRGVIYEVNNTFGETHAYVAALDGEGSHEHESEKLFHVSPLMAVEGAYRFRLEGPGERFSLVVENVVGGVRQHVATLATQARPLTDAWLARTLALTPFMTLQVVAAIYWEALKLFLKGARYHRRPPLPANAATVARAPGQENGREGGYRE